MGDRDEVLEYYETLIEHGKTAPDAASHVFHRYGVDRVTLDEWLQEAQEARVAGGGYEC